MLVCSRWISDNSSALATYGTINGWDVSLITDMSSLFSGNDLFNDDISNWDVSNVTNMSYMFLYATNFNQILSNWDVSNVTNMEGIFRTASSFDQDISNWNVSNVTDMSGMFLDANALSDGNKCSIHASFESNDAWPYDWSDFCPFKPQTKA